MIFKLKRKVEKGERNDKVTCKTKSKAFSGIWGPYYSAVLEGYWLHEGGQSAVGSLIDHLIHSHPAFKCIESKSKNVYQYLEEKCIEQAEKENLESIHWLTRKLHICPDFHGNRSPLADSEIKGTVFENYSKCLIFIFLNWHFPSIFVLLKLTCLVTLFDRKL